jgi:competence protein ComEC
MAKKSKNQKNFKLRVAICALFALLFATIFLFKQQIYQAVNNTSIDTYQATLQSQLVVHFIDVGQGDAIAIKLPDGKKMLVDSGPGKSKDKLIDYLTNNFFAQNENTFDYFLITHPHEDHIGGSVKVFEHFQINAFYRPNVYTQAEVQQLQQQYGPDYTSGLNTFSSQIFSAMVSSAVAEPNCEQVFFSALTMPMIIDGAGYTITLFTPTLLTYGIAVNNYSPIMLIEYNGKKILLTGDAETAVENEFVGIVGTLDVDVLKVGHHGSNTSTSKTFLQAITPEYAIISVGKNNTQPPNTNSFNQIK